jgi:hypothetical protein
MWELATKVGRSHPDQLWYIMQARAAHTKSPLKLLYLCLKLLYLSLKLLYLLPPSIT